LFFCSCCSCCCCCSCSRWITSLRSFSCSFFISFSSSSELPQQQQQLRRQLRKQLGSVQNRTRMRAKKTPMPVSAGPISLSSRV
jgi:hypothetical protein